ncbi:MAG: PAS domain S-box protein [Candidatus Hodarchaeota archaeon]
MKQAQIEQILKRDDVPSDVRQILTKYFRQEQKKLIEDNRILSAVLETSPVGIALIVGNSLGWTNSTMTQLLGYEIDSLNESRFQDLFPNLIEYQKVCGCLLEYSTKGEIQRVEAVLVRNDGTLIDCVLQARPIDITDIGKGVILTVTDITERKRAEEKLQESEEKYRTILENIEEGYYEVDLEGNFTFFNDSLCKSLGYSKDELEGMNNREYMDEKTAKRVYQIFNEVYRTRKPVKATDWEIIRKKGNTRFHEASVSVIIGGEGEPIGFSGIVPDDFESAAKHFEKVLDGEQIYSFEYRAKHKEGHFFPVSATGKLVGEGDDMKLVTVLRDITKQRLAEQALKESEENYRSLVEQSLQGIIVFHEGSIIFANDQVSKMSGYSVEELLSMSPEKAAELIHPEERLPMLSKMQNLLEGKQVAFQYEFRGIRKDGTVYWNEIYPKRIKYQGKPAIQVTYVDITERKNMEKAREELEIRRKRFIETTSHELRTPLTNVKGFIDFLRDHGESLPQNQVEDIYGIINKNIARLELLVSNVADLSKIDRDIFRLQRKEINLKDFLQEEIKTYKNLLGDQFEFQFQCEPKITVEIDKDRLIQVLDNVVNNAIKQTPAKRRKISMNVKKHEKMVRIEINENGAGIHHDDLERIFKPFVSLETEYSVKGTGIGLHLCQIIVENHNGTIKAHSEGLSHGSTFIIDLPFLLP